MNKETALQNQIIAALCVRGCVARNHTVGVFYTPQGKKIAIGHPGEADIDGHRPDGRAFYIEVKLPGQSPRQNQRDFLAAMGASGALAGVAHSAEEAMEIVFGKENQ